MCNMNGTSNENGEELNTNGCSNSNNNNNSGKGVGLDNVTETKAILASLNEAQSKPSNLKALQSIHGTTGLLTLLDTTIDAGISTNPNNSTNTNSHSMDIVTRRSQYGSNALPSSPRDSWWSLFVETWTDDETVQILVAAAIVSFLVGMYENPSTGWIEGSAILAACTVVSVVTATNDYQKETQFRELNQVKEEVHVLVVRNGTKTSISVQDIVIGDVIYLEAGDSIPCDGVLLKCDGLEIDESALTGEPIDIPKDLLEDPFVLSGCTATAGTASLVAIAVGPESQWGIIKAALEKDAEQTPLQFKLDRMAEIIGHVGMASAVATFIAMMVIKLLVQPTYLDDISTFSHALDAFIIGVTIVVVAVPEGLPLAVTISLAYSTKKMLKDKNLIRHLQACETMGNATNICSDKTGTLTQNRMTVVTGYFANVMVEDITSTSTSTSTSGMTVPISDSAKEIILQGIATCSTATILHEGGGDDEDDDDNDAMTNPKVIGNKTEASLLLLAESKFFGQDVYEARRVKAQFGTTGGSRMFPFSSKRKCMSVLVNNKNDSDSDWTLHHKGAGEIVLGNCTHYLESNGSVSKITSAKRAQLEQTISDFASRALRCVALAHRVNVQTIANFDPETASVEQCAEQCESNMVLDALFGIVDPLRPDVVEAVKTCQRAGIFVRMVTGDNLDTAKAIAKQAGILSKDGISITGEEFRKLTPQQLDGILPNLQVLARSSPEDKHILVQRLNGGLMPKTKEEWLEAHPGRDYATEKDLLLPGHYDEWAVSRNGVGEVVGVTGDGTNDGPALKAADVGLSMGISGTDVAKNASDIIIMDDNFSSIVKAVLWGRSVFDNIRKFLQFQLTVNVVALTITFLSAVAGYKPPLNAVMMLWVNLIMDTMGALALGTEPPTLSLLDRRPYKRDAWLINLPMWRNILVQASYQLGLLIFLLQRGPSIFGCEEGSTHHFTILFNAFVFCQVFNEFNAREIGDVFDPFKKLSSSPMFLAVIGFTILAQWGIVEFGGEFTQTVPLTAEEWKITFLMGAMSIPVGFIMRLIPVEEDRKSFAGTIFDEKTVGLEVSKGKTSKIALLSMLLPVAASAAYKINIDK